MHFFRILMGVALNLLMMKEMWTCEVQTKFCICWSDSYSHSSILYWTFIQPNSLKLTSSHLHIPQIPCNYVSQSFFGWRFWNNLYITTHETWAHFLVSYIPIFISNQKKSELKSFIRACSMHSTKICDNTFQLHSNNKNCRFIYNI